MSLELTPNEIVGYRFAVDWYNVDVVVVKKYGPNSKHAGQEYSQTLAHCKNVKSAAEWLFHHILRADGKEAQASQQALDGTAASTEALVRVVDSALQHVNAATGELQSRIDALGLTQKSLVKALGGQGVSAGEDEGGDETGEAKDAA
ncbi:conserved hypothetical protein [Ricinus communis]|uniref:Uncharacterized protein n=1 Tax=Ricinus communis TaxID=3988 RepID=B9TME0_RICCO|nr:conserved hypothetical protein [Ricinus communis]